MSKLDRKRWQGLWNRLNGKSVCNDSFDIISDAYSECHRCYHTSQHILDCLNHFDSAVDMADRPNEVEMAIWTHDAVYKIFSSDNEEKSAEFAGKILRNGCMDEDVILYVTQLVQITDHKTEPSSADEKLIVDIDLLILGQPEEEYLKYERDIRTEYKLIPSFIYNKKRAELLTSFLARKNIYHTDRFRDMHEIKARTNIKQAIMKLKKQRNDINKYAE